MAQSNSPSVAAPREDPFATG